MASKGAVYTKDMYRLSEMQLKAYGAPAVRPLSDREAPKLSAAEQVSSFHNLLSPSVSSPPHLPEHVIPL